MTVKLYNFTGSNITVNKGAYLSDPVTYDAKDGFEGNQNVEAPSVIIRAANEPLYNYAYIDTFKRYYYIISKTWLSNDLWRLSMIVDPLYTYAADISLQEGTVLYSGKGDIKKYDPRLVYNEAPIKTEKTAIPGGLYPTDGGTIWIVLGCKYFFYDPFLDLFASKTNNSMSYIAFSPEAYCGFLAQLGDPNAQSGWREAISKCIVSASLVRYLNLNKTTIPHWDSQQTSTGAFPEAVYFSSPEIFSKWRSRYETYPEGLGVLTYETGGGIEPPEVMPAVYQFTNEQIKDPYMIYFTDEAKTYSQRKAQRIIEIPYVGKINVDLDAMGIPLSVTSFWIGCEIRYDFGGGEYVVTPFWCDHEGYTQPYPPSSKIVYCRDTMLTIPNNFQIGYVSDDSYQFQSETRSAELLGLISTVAMGIVSGIATSGASVPLTAASLGIGVGNMALTEKKMQYQEASSLVQKGSSNGGSAYDTLITTLNNSLVRPKCKLYIQEMPTATNVEKFTLKYGKPDGEFRELYTLLNTGFAQLGTVTLKGFTNATNSEREQIKDALLSGVIL